MKCCDNDVHHCLTFYREQRVSELDPVEDRCSWDCPSSPYLLSFISLMRFNGANHHYTVYPLPLLYPLLYIHCHTVSFVVSRYTMGGLTGIHGGEVIHNRPSWHWPSYLSHTDIIRQGLPASHHDTQDNRTENCEAVAQRECDTYT